MRVFFCALLLVAFANSSVYAYLGGFQAADGYVDIGPFDFAIGPDYDVSKYNAGQFGANAPTYAGYSQTTTPRLWTKTMGPLIPSGVSPGAPSGFLPYATSHRFSTTSFPDVIPIEGNRALVITTNNQGWNGMPQGYDYRIDTHDLRGGDPTKTGNQTIKLSWYACAALFGTGDTISGVTGGLGPGTIGQTVSFFDGSGNLGIEVGYYQPNTTKDYAAFRVGGANAGTLTGGWKDTGIETNPTGWHRWDATFELATDRVSLAYTPVTSFTYNVPTSVVHGPTVTLLSSVAMLNSMNSLEKMAFKSTAGVNNAKVWVVDDFEFCITEAPLSDLLAGGTLWSGDKQFSDFSYHGGGDMPDAEDIFVKAITDAEGNFGIRFQGAFVDAFGGGASDALIDYKVTAGAGRLITDVNLAANPLVIGGNQGLVSITETFLPDNDDTVLSVYDIKPGSRKLTDGSFLLDENGDLAPVKELHVQKDIITWSQGLGSAATLSFIDQTFSQCDADPMNPGACIVDFPPPLVDLPGLTGDFNLDGTVDGSDYIVWRRGMGTIYTATDLENWRANFGQTADGGTASNTVPEPASLLLVALAAASAAAGRGRRGCPAT